MRIVYTKDGGKAWDITSLVSSATWSGDYKQAARTLDIEVLAGESMGEAWKVTGNIGLGDMLQLYEYGEELFRGYVFTVNKSLQSAGRTIKAYDGAVYALKSNIAQNFSGVTAQGVTRQVAGQLGLKIGTMPKDKGLALRFAHLNKSAYSAIMGAWTKVSAATGYKYIIRMDKGKLTVAIVGQEYAPYILSPASTVVDGDVSDSLEDAITQAVVTTDKGAVAAVALDEKNRARYGVLQASEAVKEGQAPGYQAKQLLKGPQQDIRLSSIIGLPGAEKLIAGNAAAVNDPALNIFGRYFILNDTHTFESGRHTVSVGLSLDALMDEMEIEEIKQKAASARKKVDDVNTNDPWATATILGGEL